MKVKKKRTEWLVWIFKPKTRFLPNLQKNKTKLLKTVCKWIPKTVILLHNIKFHSIEAVSWRCSYKFRKIHRKTPVPGSQKKKTLAQVVYCEFCEISKNTFSYRTPPVAASESMLIFKKSLLFRFTWKNLFLWIMQIYMSFNINTLDFF